MRGRRALGLGLALAATGCALPGRDNPRDPAVRPVANIVVTVGGASTAIGGRTSKWLLDGAQSSDPDGTVASHTWRIASRTASSPDDLAEEDWDDAGLGPLVSATNDAFAFGGLLLILDDFAGGPAPGTGTTARWVGLLVEDDDGNRDRAYAQLTIANSAPEISLGHDRRPSPGGQWWTDLSGSAADPWVLEIRADVSDVDGDSLAFSENLPGVWRVEGSLARSLDSDADGFLDAPWVMSDPQAGEYGRTVRFPVSTRPGGIRLSVTTGDVLRDDVVFASASAGVSVEVASSFWGIDTSTGQVERVPTGPIFVTSSGSTIAPVGTDSETILVAEDGGGGFLHLVDRSGRKLASLSTAEVIPSFAVHAVPHDGGWWVLTGGALFHLRVDGGPLRFDLGGVECPPQPMASCELTNFDGGLPDFSSTSRRLAPAVGGAVWVTTDELGFGEPHRLLLISTAGTLLASELAMPLAGAGGEAMLMEPDGSDGAWLLGYDPASSGDRRLRHLGTAPIDIPLPFSPDQMRYDPVSQRLYFTGVAPGDPQRRLFRRDPDGSYVSQPIAIAGALHLEPGASDGVLLVGQVIGRYDVETLELRKIVTLPPTISLGRTELFEGGALVSEEYPQKLVFLEAGSLDTTVFAQTVLPPSLTGVSGIALDPVTGELWLANTSSGLLERFAPSGELLDTIDLGPLSSSAVTVDPLSRRVWVATAPAAGAGSLRSFGIASPGVPPVLVTQTDGAGAALAVNEVFDIVVASGGERICLAADLAVDPGKGGFAIDRDGSVQITAAPVLSAAMGAPGTTVTHDPVGGACWFVPQNITGLDGIWRIDAAGSVEGFDIPDTVNGGNFGFGTSRVDPETGALVVALNPGEDNPGEPWFGRYLSGAPDFVPNPIQPSINGGDFDAFSTKALVRDPLHGHLVMTVWGFAENPLVVRLAEDGSVISIADAPAGPFLSTP